MMIQVTVARAAQVEQERLAVVAVWAAMAVHLVGFKQVGALEVQVA
jgi:hypothetical protein